MFVVCTDLFLLGLMQHFVYRSDIKLGCLEIRKGIVRKFLSIDLIALSSM